MGENEPMEQETQNYDYDTKVSQATIISKPMASQKVSSRIFKLIKKGTI